MTFERFELTCISQMLSVASFSEEIEDDKVFARIEQKISYAIISGCESITFTFRDKEIECLDKATKIAVKNAEKEWIEHYGSIREKVEEELKERGMIRVDNATSTTSNT